jgi:hypothetical protein
MGFLDRAKQIAEQAQDKLDEVQKQFNESQAAKSGGDSGPATEYDKHGRPVGQTQPEATAESAVAPDAAPDAGPVAPSAPEASPPPPPPPAADTPREGPVTPPAAPPAPSDRDDDPPQVTHGDPLAG